MSLIKFEIFSECIFYLAFTKYSKNETTN